MKRIKTTGNIDNPLTYHCISVDVQCQVALSVINEHSVPPVVDKIPFDLFPELLPHRFNDEHDAFDVYRELDRIVIVLLREQVSALKIRTIPDPNFSNFENFNTCARFEAKARLAPERNSRLQS